ncbi:MAG: hypothetical protein AAGA29_11720 [Planctomycetota bacterium]
MPPTKPPPHPDDQLPTLLRWATRLFSSLWLLAALISAVALYLIVVFIPVTGSYLWQAPTIDLPQERLLNWLPFHVLLATLTCVLLWTTIRRVPWRWRNLGLFLFALGIVLTAIGLSTAWRFQTRGLLAAQPIGDEATALQTRYLDPAHRALFVQVGNEQPQQVPLDGLPLWNDAGLGRLTMPLHQQPGLRSQLNYRAQVHAVAYIAHGKLNHTDAPAGLGGIVPTPTPPAQRDWPIADCPPDALLAVRFTANSAEGPTSETLVWLPFDLAAGQRVTPPQAYEIPGLGRVRLAFTLASKDLGFAVTAEPDGRDAVKLRILDTDPATRQVIPPLEQGLQAGQATHYRPVAPIPTMSRVSLTAGPALSEQIAWVTLRSTPALPLVWAGLAAAALGILTTLGTRIASPAPHPPS